MSDQPIVTFSFFHYGTRADRWWGFRQMGLGYDRLKEVEGLAFVKLLGSGRDGFSIFPNWSRYGLLAVWSSEAAARQFFQSHAVIEEFRSHSTAYWTIYLRTAMVHGQWSGGNPFEVTQDFDPLRPVAVLTRATIRTRHLINFWRRVPKVSHSIQDKPGLLFAVGVGELPLVQQATFSLWESSKKMQAYAYQSAHHREVIKRTRELGWYKEELFARFHPFDDEGEWPGLPTWRREDAPVITS